MNLTQTKYLINELESFTFIMVGVVKIDYVKYQKPTLNVEIKTSSSMDL